MEAKMKKTIKTTLIVSLILLTHSLVAAAPQPPPIFDKTQNWTIPDLSQTNNPGWPPTYCAPTAATIALWAFFAGDAGLIQTGANDNARADNTISMLAGPAYMNTNPVTGTSIANMETGLRNYANFFGSKSYTVTFLTAFNTGPGGIPGDGHTLWGAMMDELYRCEQVLPIISFIGEPIHPSWLEDLNLDSIDGHVVTMTGYDGGVPEISVNDPGNNGVHQWPPENAAWNLVPHANSLHITNGQYAGNFIVGAMTMSPVPIPSAFWLLGLGLVGLVGFRRKFRKA
jgi:hypothetical protein